MVTRTMIVVTKKKNGAVLGSVSLSYRKFGKKGKYTSFGSTNAGGKKTGTLGTGSYVVRGKRSGFKTQVIKHLVKSNKTKAHLKMLVA